VRLTGYTKWISVSYSYEVVTSVEPVARRKATPPMRNDKAAVAAPPNQPSAPSVNELIAQGIAIEGNDSLSDRKKWELLNSMGLCRFCLLAMTGKLQAEMDRLSAQGLNAGLFNPKCAGCSSRRGSVTP
jgi:hypothetical protein